MSKAPKGSPHAFDRVQFKATLGCWRKQIGAGAFTGFPVAIVVVHAEYAEYAGLRRR